MTRPASTPVSIPASIPASTPARRRPGLRSAAALSALTALAACRGLEGPGPALGGDVALGGGVSAGPRVGALLGGSQRVFESDALDAHVEIELHRQDLEPTRFEGERFDGSWSQVRGGFKFVLPEADAWAWTGRAGVTWVRPVGDPVFVDDPEDYGGFYLGVGRDRLLGPRLLLSPDLAVLGLFEEGKPQAGFGVQLTLRLLWLP